VCKWMLPVQDSWSLVHCGKAMVFRSVTPTLSVLCIATGMSKPKLSSSCGSAIIKRKP
jgi:hypothetical protein